MRLRRSTRTTTIEATGNGTIIQRASLQSKTASPTDIITNIRIVPNNCGIALENVLSNAVQSPIIVVVRSAKFFFSKNDSGSFLSFSASTIHRFALSLYAAVYVKLYCTNWAIAIMPKSTRVIPTKNGIFRPTLT